MTTSTVSDLTVIDRIGTAALVEHFRITRQNVYYWRVKGIPRQYRKAMVLLGESLNHDMSDFAADEAA